MYHSPTRHAPLSQAETGTFPNQGNWADHIKQKGCESKAYYSSLTGDPLMIVAQEKSLLKQYIIPLSFPTPFPHSAVCIIGGVAHVAL